jgi:hypothetical protein
VSGPEPSSLEVVMKLLHAPIWFRLMILALFVGGCGSKQDGSDRGPKLPEITAQFKSMDRNKMMLNLLVDGKEKELPFTKQTKFFSGDGFDISEMRDLSRGLKNAMVTVKLDKKEGKDVAIEVRAHPPGE